MALLDAPSRDAKVERYEMQVELVNVLINYYTGCEALIERVYNFAEKDLSWKYFGGTRWKQDWEQAGVITQRSAAARKKLDTAVETVLGRWGVSAQELIEGERYNVVSKIRTIATDYDLKTIRKLLQMTIVARLKRKKK